MQADSNTKEFIGNIGTSNNNEALLFTPTIFLPFETFDKQFFTLSAGLGIGLIQSKGIVKEITKDLNDSYIYGDTHEWITTLFGISKNLGISYSVFFKGDDRITFSWFKKDIKAYSTDIDAIYALSGFRLYYSFNFASE